MKKLIGLLGLLTLFALPYGCESNQDSHSNRQEEQEREAGKHIDETKIPERDANIRAR